MVLVGALRVIIVKWCIFKTKGLFADAIFQRLEMMFFGITAANGTPSRNETSVAYV